MATNDGRSAGGCHCGAVRYALDGPVTSRCFCHCQSCRRVVGATPVPWGTVARDGFTLTRGTLTEHESSPGVHRGLCGRCGSSLTYRHEQRADEIDVTLSTLDDPSALAPEAHIWVRDKLPWVHLADALPRFETVRPEPD